MERQFTATVYIISQNRILMIFHKKHQKWLPPGGHLQPNETPVEAARREVREETGLEISFVNQENIWIDRWNAKSMERPYLCLIEEIPVHQNQSTHQHIDFIYLATPSGGEEQRCRIETEDMCWFSLKEIESLKPDQEIFIETQLTLKKIFEQNCLPTNETFFKE